MDSSAESNSAAPTPDLDALMEKIRAEVAERKALRGTHVVSESEQISATEFADRSWSARELLALPGADFARAMHLAFFGREPSPEEFVRLRDRLLVEHVGRTRILREFRRSPEARSLQLPVHGLAQQLIRDRIYWSPPAKFGRAIGRGARNLWLLPRHIRDFMARVALLERRSAEMTAALKNLQTAQVTERQNTNQRTRRLLESQETLRKNLNSRVDELQRQLDGIADILKTAKARLTEAESKLVDHWRSIIEYKFELQNRASGLPTAGESQSDSRALSPRAAREASHLLDALYVSFEDRYRGTREEIKERLRFYLSRVETAHSATDRGLVIDIGCGRGEWLEVLSESGIAARGIDLNRIAIDESRKRGLQVELAEGVATLSALASESCSAVTAFHIIEHLPFESVVELLDQSLRVLRPGGVLVVETPNPANLLVAAERFYLDPTHRNPLPSQLTAWLFQARGFEQVEILPLHPVPSESLATYSDTMLGLLQQKLYGPQDYGVIGRKSA